MVDHIQATEPEHLGRFFIERANAGDVAGLLALYETDAVLVAASGELARGTDAIRRVLEHMVAEMLARGMTFAGKPSLALRRGDLALTSTRFSASFIGLEGTPTTRNGITAEVARQQTDNTWLFAIDQPNMAG